jgi:catechol 2,3-dioxygenase-like lactoylglutathione lyase family enzyme
MPPLRGGAITIACTDRRRSEHFYEKILGAKISPGDGYGCPWLQLGSLTISLMPNASEPSPAKFPERAMPMLYLEADDLAAVRKYFRKNKIKILEDDDVSVTISDPDGILIEVWEADPDRPRLQNRPGRKKRRTHFFD